MGLHETLVQDKPSRLNPQSVEAAAGSTARFTCLEGLIGRTPLLRIEARFKGAVRTVYAKAEHYNLTGSIKDRMALHVLRRAYATGALKPGDTIVEATSGNAGIAFAALGRALGHKVRIFMPDWMSEERKAILRGFGAELTLVSREDGGFLGAIAQAEALGEADPSVFLPRQFDNKDNCAAHFSTTGPEIVKQLKADGATPDAFVAGVGTGGTIMGVSGYLKRAFPECRAFAIEPRESPTLSTGHKVGKHRIQGVSDDFIPAIVDLDALDGVRCVSDGDAIRMAQRLSHEFGLGVGISSGGNLIAALDASVALGDGAVVATVFCDDNKKYLSTDLSKEEPHREDHRTPEIELLDIGCIRCG